MAKMGDRIRELRKERGWTLEELSKKINMKATNLSKYERGDLNNMKRSTIELLSNLFDVSPMYLMGYSDERQPLEALISKLDTEDRQIVAGMVKMLLAKEKYK